MCVKCLSSLSSNMALAIHAFLHFIDVTEYLALPEIYKFNKQAQYNTIYLYRPLLLLVSVVCYNCDLEWHVQYELASPHS